MGVDYYTCPVCDYTFPDCGEYDRCGGCGRAFHKWCGKIECHCNEDPDDPHKHEECDEGCKKCSCVVCRDEVVLDEDLAEFLLSKCRLTREQAVEEFRQANCREEKK